MIYAAQCFAAWKGKVYETRNDLPDAGAAAAKAAFAASARCLACNYSYYSTNGLCSQRKNK